MIGFTDEVWDVMQRGWAQNPEHRSRLVEVRRALAADTQKPDNPPRPNMVAHLRRVIPENESQDPLGVEKRLLNHKASICAGLMNDAVLRIHSVMDRRAEAVRSAMPGAGYTQIGSTHVKDVEWRRQSALDVARTQIAEAEEAVRRLEDELRRAESAAATQQSEMARRKEEAARREEEATRREEEATRKEREATRREEEATRKEKEATRREEEATRKEEEAKRREEDLARREAEMEQELANLRREKEEARLQTKQARRQDEAARVEVEDL
jgi:flagellar biosynthesis GTPase FlhF